MTEIKNRNCTYDAVRGFCMFLIVLQHFTFKGGYTFTSNTGNLIYVGIDMFVMQAFFFLSGLFSRKPEKNRDKMFKSLLWPVIVVGLFFWPAAICYLGYEPATILFRNGMVPYAMWFLVVLFVFRYFQVYYCKMKHLFAFALGLYLLSGVFEPLSSHGFALSRMCTFFISFVMGYLIGTERTEKFTELKRWQTAALGIILIGITYATVTYLPPNIYEAVKLSSSYSETNLSVWEGMLFRLGLLAVSSGWIVFLLNIFPSRKGFWAHVGMNTMPIYIFHLAFSGIFMVKGFTFGLYDFAGHEALYVFTLFAVSLLMTAVLSLKPAQKAYTVLTEDSYSALVSAVKSIKPVPAKRPEN